MVDDKELKQLEQVEEDNISVTDETATMLLDDDADHDAQQQPSGEVDVDAFIRHTGNFGRYQILLMIMITISAFPTSYPVLLFYFIGHGPDWKCTGANSACLNVTTHHTPEDTARCHMNRTAWTYSHANKSTIVTEFDLVCDRAWLDALSGSSAFIGWGIGILVTGYISDQYGRKKVMFICLGAMLVTLMAHYFVTGVWMLIVLRFVMGIFFSAPALLQFLMLVELIAPKYRVIACNICQFAWPVAAGLLVIKAYYLQSWRTLCLLCSAPYFFVLLTAFFIPESVRWLHTKGRKHAAEEILRRVARINRKSLPSNLSLQDFDHTTTLKTKVTYWDMVKQVKILKQIVAQAFIWFHCGLTYYALNWEFADIGGDMYINSILSFLVELPGNIVIIFTLQRFGRKRMNLIFSALTTITCLAVAAMPKTEALKTVRLVFGLLGKCFISCLFGGIYMWSSELFATVTRTQGMAIMVVTSRLGAALSPFIKLLYTFHPSAPFGLMTFTSITATLLCLTLTETANQKTRETLDDMIGTQVVMTELPVVTDFNDNMNPTSTNPGSVLTYDNEGIMDDENIVLH